MRFLVPIIIGGIVIFLGSRPGDVSQTQSRVVLEWLMSLGFFGTMDYGMAIFIVRKLAHLSEFALFGLTTKWAFDKYLEDRSESIAFILAVTLAIADECRQIFTTGRSAKVQDVLIDIVGAMLGMAIYNLFRRKHNS